MPPAKEEHRETQQTKGVISMSIVQSSDGDAKHAKTATPFATHGKRAPREGTRKAAFNRPRSPQLIAISNLVREARYQGLIRDEKPKS